MTTAVITERAVLGIGLEARGSRLLVAGYGANLEAIVPELWSLDADSSATLPETMSSANVLEAAAAHLSAAGVTGVIPFKPSVSFERVAQRHGLTVLAATARCARQIENKLQLPEIATSASVSFPETVVVSRREVAAGIAELPDLSAGWVLQPAMGFAGAGTAPLNSHAELLDHLSGDAVPKADLWKLTRLITGDPLTVNGVVFHDGDVVVAHVARQLTGIAQCSNEPLGSCGNEWSIPISAQVHDTARHVAQAIGGELSRRAFVGAFGIDLVATAAGDIVVIEINPRITASFGMLNHMQRRHGLVPLIDVHEAACRGTEHATAIRTRARECYGDHIEPWSDPAASIVCYNTDTEDVRAVVDEPQIWTHNRTRLATTIGHESLGVDDVLVIPQSSHRAVAPGGELFRLYLARQVAADHRCRELLPDTSLLVKRIPTLLDVQRSSESHR